MAKKIVLAIFLTVVFLTFFNGYKASGPARGKFKKLGESGPVDLTRPEVTPDPSLLNGVVGDKRVRTWAAWWRQCATGFSLEGMDDVGRFPLYDEALPYAEPQGPSKMFYARSPDGGLMVNPYWGRLRFEKENDAWQPYIELPCGAALYYVKGKRGRRIIDCSTLEGIDDAYWKDKDTIILMGYEAITRQMNVECEGTETCFTPVVWITDIKSNTYHEFRGTVITRSTCELGGYLKHRLPDFFGEGKN